MDIRQLEALLAVAEEGSFTAAADRLHTVQSNVSEHVRQLEAELGVQLLVRGRRGAVPTEFGVKVLERARAIRSELDALHKDLSMLQGLADRSRDARRRRDGEPRGWCRRSSPRCARVAPGVSLRLTEGASERLAVEVAERELAFAVVTEPVTDTRLVVEHLRDEDARRPVARRRSISVCPSRFPLAALARTRLDPAARREPAARRGRHRRAGRTR